MEKPVEVPCGPSEPQENRPHLGWRVHFLELVVISYFIGYVLNFMMSVQFVYARLESNLLREGNVTLNGTVKNSHCVATIGNDSGAQIVARAQNMASSWQLYLSLVGGIPSVFATILLGSLSDRIGRKVLLLLPAVGAAIRSATYCAVSYWGLPLYCLLIVHGIEGCTGSFVATLLASFAYTSDITARGKKRSLQITIMESMLGIALGISNLTLGFMIKEWGYTVPNIPALVMNISAGLVTVFLLPETRKSGPYSKSPSLGKAFYRVFHFYFSTKNGNPRDCYLISIATFAMASLAFVGASGVETLYVLNEPFCWNSVQIGYFATTRALCQAFAAVLIVKLLQFCLSDVGIALVSGACKVASLLLEGFATKDAYMYVVAVIGMSGIAVLAMIRSIMSKMTPKDKLGAVFASIASVEAVTNMTASIAFVAIYQETLTFYDGTVFFCMAFVVSVSMVLYLILHYKLKRREAALMQVQQAVIVNEERKPLLGNRETGGY
ncbi:lysosomal proton-coupled steroid conjugate and bile acid symporter SLC46A3-like [Liolophura sinensis]|uniref:lysosomal proton-coupled steroid conjugate and bile acid symporter SLC46A3-like n=1 Tax=Liolophura sinensis TaxID=3198878 RepID=UPI0031580C9B